MATAGVIAYLGAWLMLAWAAFRIEDRLSLAALALRALSMLAMFCIAVAALAHPPGALDGALRA